MCIDIYMYIYIYTKEFTVSLLFINRTRWVAIAEP